MSSLDTTVRATADVPLVEVTTTGLYGLELENVKGELLRHGMNWCEDLTSRTRVLIAHSRHSRKLTVARQQGIPCVSCAWAQEGNCSLERVAEYDVRRDIHGKEVCTSGLGSSSRGQVQSACQQCNARICSVLSRSCVLLVVEKYPLTPDIVAANAKVQFSIKHGIPMMSVTDFLSRYSFPPPFGPRTSTMVSMGPSSTYSVHSSSEPLSHPLQGGGRAGSSIASTLSDALTHAPLLSDVVVCPVPASSAVHAAVRPLLRLAGCKVSYHVTEATTHMIFTEGAATRRQAVYPRHGLEFVSVKWIEDCVALHKRVSCVPYRLPVEFCPIITFTSLSATRKDALVAALSKAGLLVTVQDTFVLGTGDNGVPGKLANTSHLVVPQSQVLSSRKVSVVSNRFFSSRRKECHVIDIEWVVRSAAAGRWLDCDPFSVPLPTPSAFMQSKRPCCNVAVRAGEPLVPHTSPSPVPAGLPVQVLPPEEEEGANSQESVERLDKRFSETLPSLTLEGLLGDLEGFAPASSITTPTMLSSPFAGRPSVEAEHVEEEASTPLAEEDACGSQADGNQHQHGQQGSSVKMGQYHLPTSLRGSLSVRAPTSAESQFVYYYRPGGGSASTGLDGDDVNMSKAATPPARTEGNLFSESREFSFLIAKDAAKELRDIDGTLAALPHARRASGPEDCTHFITTKPAKTEQFLCCMAAGKWVVMPSLLTASVAAGGGQIVSELSHDWTPERARSLGCRSSVVSLVRGCQWQRTQPSRPYAKWRVVLTCSSVGRFESFARVLRCGGCASVSASTPVKVLEEHASRLVEDDAEDAMRLVLSDDNVWTERELETYCGYGSRRVLRLEYLVHCLCAESPTVMSDFELLNSMRSRKRQRAEDEKKDTTTAAVC